MEFGIINLPGSLGSLVSHEVLETLGRPGRYTKLVILSCSKAARGDISLFLSLNPPVVNLDKVTSFLWLRGHEAESQKTIILTENRIRISCFSNCALMAKV